MTTPYEDVAVFHAKFGLPYYGQNHGPSLINPYDFRYRVNFLWEELREFVEAHATENLADAADSLADLIWVALGTAHYMRVPLDEIWAEIRRANMEKRPWREGDAIKPRNYTAGEIVKPKGWKPPDIEEVIRRMEEVRVRCL